MLGTIMSKFDHSGMSYYHWFLEFIGGPMAAPMRDKRNHRMGEFSSSNDYSCGDFGWTMQYRDCMVVYKKHRKKSLRSITPLKILLHLHTCSK